jgi:hypothetical protein
VTSLPVSHGPVTITVRPSVSLEAGSSFRRQKPPQPRSGSSGPGPGPAQVQVASPGAAQTVPISHGPGDSSTAAATRTVTRTPSPLRTQCQHGGEPPPSRTPSRAAVGARLPGRVGRPPRLLSHSAGASPPAPGPGRLSPGGSGSLALPVRRPRPAAALEACSLALRLWPGGSLSLSLAGPPTVTVNLAST